MDAEILFPEIRFSLNLVCLSNQTSRVSPAPRISKARRRKIRLMKKKNSMVSSSFKSERLDSDGSYLPVNNGGVQPPALVRDGNGCPTDSAVSVSPVVNLSDSPVVVAAVSQCPLPRYNLRPRVSRCL